MDGRRAWICSSSAIGAWCASLMVCLTWWNSLTSRCMCACPAAQHVKEALELLQECFVFCSEFIGCKWHYTYSLAIQKNMKNGFWNWLSWKIAFHCVVSKPSLKFVKEILRFPFVDQCTGRRILNSTNAHEQWSEKCQWRLVATSWDKATNRRLVMD